MIYTCVCVCVYQAATADLDVVRIAEIDQLIKAGNWDVRFSLNFFNYRAPLSCKEHALYLTFRSTYVQGIVAVAARYGEEADMADEQLKQPPLHHGTVRMLSSSL
jgi:hypothetical protein